MKKKIILLVLLVIILPLNVFAYPSSNSVGETGSQTKLVTGSCGAGGLCRNEGNSGVRITFVDQNGRAVSSSFDFVDTSNNSGRSVVHNDYNGDKSKIGGNTSYSKTTMGSYPTFSDLVSAFSSNCTSDCKARNYSAHGDFSFGQEQKWFNSLTDSHLTGDQFTANINSLAKAIESIYPGNFNAEAFSMQLSEACNSDKEIYIQIEPMFLTYWGDGYENVFGTLRDQAYYYEENYQASARLFEKYKYWKYGKLMYYNDTINDTFEGYDVSDGSDVYNSLADLDSTKGSGAALDWASDNERFCSGCTYQDGEFKYDDKPILDSDYAASYANIYEYAFSPGPDGMNCCEVVSESVSGNSAALPEDVKEYYDFYCDNKGDPCTKKTFEALGETRYFCADGTECDEAKYEEQCDPPDDCEETGDEPPGNKCCEEDPIEVGKIEGEVNNCCSDNTESEAHDYDLDELFCNNDYLGVDNYQTKCGAQFYVNEDTELEEDYCSMFCTERIFVEIPGAITATSGRYFKLNTTSRGGTSSSYIEGYRRCRIRIQYDKWEKDYYDTVVEQKDAYNSFQENKGYQKLYEKAEAEVISGQTETSDISCSCTCSYTGSCPNADGKGSHPCKLEETVSDSGSCTIKYNKYPFKEMFKINPVKINKDLRNECENIYDAIEFKDAAQYKTEHNDWSAWEIDPSITECDNKVKSMEVSKKGTNCSCTLSCKRTTTTAETRREDVHTVRQNYNDAADADNQSYNSYADTAKELEDIIDKCDLYFKDYEGADGPANYKLETTQEFYYTQIYMDEYSQLQLDEIYVNFEETPGCVTDAAPVTGADSEDNLSDDQYSEKFGNGQEKMTDFKNTTLEYEKNKGQFKKYTDEPYDADKIFTTDAKYHATCKWNEGENKLHTLVPSGAAVEDEPNGFSEPPIYFTVHQQQYKLYLTTLEGTYQTYWNIDGLGTPRNGETKGRFDKYFKEAGNMCSGEAPSGYTTLTCKITSLHELVLMGYCNGEWGVAVDPEIDCDPYKEGYPLFNFKVVDPVNLFPSGTDTVDGSIAYNWINTTEGQQAMQEIQATGAVDKTYAPENLTYSFALSPSDMQSIKQYNASRVDDGGYGDFLMECNRDTCDAGACSQCKSRFLTSLGGWSNPNRDITAIRRSYGWAV